MATDGATLPEDTDGFRSALIEWYAENRREFPWRDTTDPYPILVSEIMSQQTQLSRVEDAYRAFLDRWPSVESLASAPQSDVVGFWSAHRLGYNNRARYLHEAASMIVAEFDGTIPSHPEQLETLPGVGPYTANAVASFAFNSGGAVVDTNVKRILYRALDVPDDDVAFQSVADALLPTGESCRWNNAMMELGALVCEPTPNCDAVPCPWREWCHAYATTDFTAPDVPTQPAFEGSRRQFRGRVIRTLQSHEALGLDDLGHRIRVDYSPGGEYGRDWLEGLLADLADDDLITLTRSDGDLIIRLRE